ncbi:unnamed protein product [Schistosoma curassoni]|uniref:Uncharacterized protein n=1 Tax=Schistosoma curassoni TaxID=6186 RepID=A0A183JJN9_9TREM|nr:unnamed protein product [Schistosoma curassoni]
MVYLSLFLYSIQYFIGYNRSLWFTVTPCTNLLNRIEFVGSSAYNEPWEESKDYGLQLSKSDICEYNFNEYTFLFEYLFIYLYT